MDFLTLLTYFPDARKNGTGFKAKCPAHADVNPSLKITAASNGNTLLKCFAGCSTEAIVAAAGLSLGDLFAAPLTNQPKPTTKLSFDERIERTYDYCDEAGALLFQSVRLHSPKDFRQRRPDGSRAWMWKLDGVRLVPYRLPELLDSSGDVFIPEGEKDVDALSALGLIATTNPMGAGKWSDEYSASLHGRNVVILPDNDAAGRQHAQAVARSLQSVAASVKVLELPGLPDRGDVSDWIAAQYAEGMEAETIAEHLCLMTENAPAWQPVEATPLQGATASAVTVKVAHAQVLKTILEELEPYDQLKRHDLKEKQLLVMTIRRLLEVVKQRQFRLARKNDFVFVYNGEYWREVNRDGLKTFLGRAAERLGVSDDTAQHYQFIDKLYLQFLAAAYFEEVETDNDKVLINLRNGTFEISVSAQDLRDFDSADFLKHQLPFDYDKTAQAPKFQAYLKRVLPEAELQNVMAEFFGYVFTRNLKLEKALLLYGSGANGKSVLFDVMNALLGKENTANYSLADLMQEHNRAQIANKLLNYGSEINAAVTKDVFKNLVSGEPIMARLKYGNSFLMENYAKLCFNCNDLPKDIEQTDAYFRRLLIVPFSVTIPDEEQDKELARKIINAELSGVFNWVLSGLQRLLKHKRFTDSKIVREAIKEYREEADSVACFIKESECEPIGLLKEVYADYRGYCLDSGMKPLGKQNFRKRLEAHGYDVDKKNLGMLVSKRE